MWRVRKKSAASVIMCHRWKITLNVNNTKTKNKLETS